VKFSEGDRSVNEAGQRGRQVSERDWSEKETGQ
jgi:hypothetical protein